MDGRAFDGLWKGVLTLAFAGAAVIGGGAYVAGRMHQDGDHVIGVRVTQEHDVLRRNGALCDAWLAQAFGDAVKAYAGGEKDKTVVTLALPSGAAQQCPPAP